MSEKIATGSRPICTVCGVNPITIKKRGLCMRCYQKLRNAGLLTADSIGELPSAVCDQTIAKIQNLNEIQFIKSFFGHFEWIPQPCTFRLPSGVSYRPDFYDGIRNVFIEVAGTKQAYYSNKTKYVEFAETYPLISFEVRKKNGELIDFRSTHISWACEEINENESVA